MSMTLASVSSAVTRSARVQTVASLLLMLGLWVLATTVFGVTVLHTAVADRCRFRVVGHGGWWWPSR
jgi:hypothetical protein